MRNHINFIQSPITDILDDAVTASAGIGSGIETYPLYDYIMQSIFLKITGYQEQKMKCICWELATNDYEYRYRNIYSKGLSECSNYNDKNKIYADLIAQIKKYKLDFNVSDQDKEKILGETIEEIKNIFLNTNLSIWAQKNFNEFIASKFAGEDHFIVNKNKKNKQLDKTELFNNTLQDKYAMLYKYRNSCAHNTKSYQQNLPTLKTLQDENYADENYFIWFAILLLIDKIFILFFNEYLDLRNNEI